VNDSVEVEGGRLYDAFRVSSMLQFRQAVTGYGSSALRNTVVASTNQLYHTGTEVPSAYAKQSANFTPVSALVGFRARQEHNVMNQVCVRSAFHNPCCRGVPKLSWKEPSHERNSLSKAWADDSVSCFV
jgi:hypothetical protein